MAAGEIERIVDELEREFRGDPWHGSPLLDILDGVDHRLASARPLPGAHTIWEIVLHLTGWKQEVAKRLQGATPGEPPGGDWPKTPEATEAAWKQAVEGLTRAHDNLIATIRRVPEETLYQPTRDPRNRETGIGVSNYVLLHGLVQHDVYHSGQIAILKRGA